MKRWAEERSQWLVIHPRPWDAETRIAYHRRFSKKRENFEAAIALHYALLQLLQAAFDHTLHSRYGGWNRKFAMDSNRSC